jgi:biopolymer transport protein ExbD
MLQLKKNNPSKIPVISTAALPDIVFILLFFFMTVTTIKNQDLLVENILPLANETEKLNKTDRIIEIFVGQLKPMAGSSHLEMAQIQIEDRLVKIDEVGHQAIVVLNTMPEHLRKVATISIKADKKVKMGVISDIKRELRNVNLLKINYTAIEGNAFENLLN